MITCRWREAPRLACVPRRCAPCRLAAGTRQPGTIGVRLPRMRRHQASALLLVSVVLTLAGCSGFDAIRAPSSSMTSVVRAPASSVPTIPAGGNPPTPGAITSPVPSSSLVIHADGHAVTSFATPTGGIVCDVGSDAELRCEVSFSTWSLPPRPAGCQEGWGGSVDFGVAGGTLTCPHDSIISDAAPGAPGTWWQATAAAHVVTANVTTNASKGVPVVVLPYGASVVVGGSAGTLTCAVAPTGVTCEIGRHRMMISRASYSFS